MPICLSDGCRFLNDCRKYGLPVWVTEFACPIGPGQHEVSQELFMASAVDHMQAAGMVERYAQSLVAQKAALEWALLFQASINNRFGLLILRQPAGFRGRRSLG